VFITGDGEVIKQFRKKWEANTDGCLDKLMAEFAKQAAAKDAVIELAAAAVAENDAHDAPELIEEE
jgi:hypothetical protein